MSEHMRRIAVSNSGAASAPGGYANTGVHIGDVYLPSSPVAGAGPRALLTPEEFWRGQTPPLPGHGQHLVGRDEQAAALRDVLGSAGAPDGLRIVVVEGSTGVGKTRLAVDVSAQVATTLVVRAGALVSVGDLSAVPRDTPVVVVVDDARLGSQLSCLAVMVNDPTYGQVKIVLTMPSGIARHVLAEAGLRRPKPLTITLGPLTSKEIDQIVTNHGITSDDFRRHVAAIAAGNPLVAHAACELAERNGTLSWQDSSDLLRKLFEDRLDQIPNVTTEHHAAAVALAVMTRAMDGEDLARLAGAITALPSEPDRLDSLLGDLVRAGIADESPYALRPDAIGPVVAAGALAGTDVKIKTNQVLMALGGVGLGSAGEPLAENVNATVLATQLAVLAQAAHQTAHQTDKRACLGTLHRAVLGRVEAPAALDTWLEVLILAGQVAPFSPPLLGHLRDALISQWPLAPGKAWWNEDPEQAYRFGVERLLRQATTLAEQVGPADADRAVRWILDVAWLAHPVLPRQAVEFAQSAIASLIKVRLRASAESRDHLFVRRAEVLEAVLRWGRERRRSDPVGLAPQERSTRDHVVTEEVLFAGLRPFLTVVTGDLVRGVPGDDDVMVWSHQVLPDDPRAASILAAATGAVSELIQRLDLVDPRSKSLLDEIARLPFSLRGEGARGLSGTAPLPNYAVQALAVAGDAVGAALAARWGDLPLMVRHVAAEHAVRPVGRTATRLADLAEIGDPIATAAVADPALTQLLVLMPLNERISLRAQDDDEADRIEHQRRDTAEQLAEQLSISDSLAVLDSIDESTANTFGRDCLGWFATAVGRNAEPVEVAIALNRLALGPLTADAALLTGLIQTHLEPVIGWLTANLTCPYIAWLALAVAAELPAEREIEVFDTALSMVTRGRSPAHGTTEPPEGVIAPDTTHTEAELDSVGNQLARSLVHGRQPAGERLARLVALGADCSSVVLSATLGSIGFLLQRTAVGERPTTNDPDLRQGLVAVLGRALGESDRDPYAPVDYDVAIAAVALAVAAPDELAELLMRRILAEVDPVLPRECQELFASADAQARGAAALALRDRIEDQRDIGALTERIEATAVRVLSQLGAESDGWVQMIRQLAAGTADDRARAVQLIKDSWRHPAWLQIVPDLIDAGLDEQSITALHQGLIPDSLGANLLSQLASRTEVLTTLSKDSRNTVRGFASEAIQNLGTLRDY